MSETSKNVYKKMFPELFSPLKVRGKVLKNRVVSSPHGSPDMLTTDSSGLAVFSEDAARYYGGIARGGAAIVNTGHLGVDPRFYLGAHKEYFDFHNQQYVNLRILPPMHKITERIHAYGALASMELNHGGQWCTPLKGNRLIGPSDQVKEDGMIVEAMDEKEMDYVADCFAEAAYIGKRAGFDIINIHAGHNWLLGSFFSPIENTRTDQYGGSVENRARFPKMVVDRIRARVGNEMILAMRISASEIQKGGITIEDVTAIAGIMSETVDIIQCSAGKIHNSFTETFTFPSQYMQQGCNTHFAAMVRNGVSCPVETVGGINDPYYANELIKNGVADLVGMARSFIADPDWAEKARLGHAEDIRPCIRCLHCMDFCEPLDSSGSVSHCSVNPRRVFHEPLEPVYRSGLPKNVVVIGGGPAGMNAAVELADQGNQVTLLEQGEKLGGRLSFADFLRFKDGVRRYREYLIRQVEKRKAITVRLNCRADRALVQELHPDAIVVAVGAEKFLPPVPGVEKKNVIHASDVFGCPEKIGDRVVVIGGGDVGCELTIQLQIMQKQVVLVEAADRLMKFSKGFWEEKVFTEFFMTHEYPETFASFDDLEEISRVQVHLNSFCSEITDTGVYFTDETGKRAFAEADTVILATGLRTTAMETSGLEDLAETVLFIGDCRVPSNIENAARDGYYASLRI